MKHQVAYFATRHPRLVYALTLLLVVGFAGLMPAIQIDTDPENMLPADEAHRVFHNLVEEKFTLHDAIVVGAVNESHPNGIYNARSLAALHALSEAISRLEGVVVQDMMSLAAADNITQESSGAIRFEWLMHSPPATDREAVDIRDAVERLPLLMNTLVSGDGKAAAIYVPITSKDLSHQLALQIREIAGGLDSGDQYHVTGLPVAEDTFGYQMFVQMGISAPLAGLMIFLIMWYFFRSPMLVIAPMIVAMVTVIVTMGLLIGLGFTVHIMSSMIPIFLMPIAVVDSVHMMSEFADSYQEGQDPGEAIGKVIDHLYTPMLYTSLTSAIGFGSLLLTPIPPVQIFGAFVAFGVMLAFLLTVTFIPAYVVRMNPAQLARLHAIAVATENSSLVTGALRRLGRLAFSRPAPVIAAATALLVFSIAGIVRIEINDNPVRWFRASHEIRVADATLNEHFAGTYDAYLVLSRPLPAARIEDFVEAARQTVAALGTKVRRDEIDAALAQPLDLNRLVSALDDALFEADGDEAGLLDDLLEQTEALQREQGFFLEPRNLEYVESLQQALMASGAVGKTNALPDVVKVVNRELRGGSESDYRLPETAAGTAQTLLQYQSSHRPHDLWHMVTPDHTETNVWVQLTSGDNQDMTRVIAAVDEFLENHPPPDGTDVRWAGKTFINVVWQDAMVNGMLMSLLGAFGTVLVIMIVLFRSIAFGLIAMLPLSLTIAFVYGLIGWVGKDYDMPIAVLSSLTLGLSVDFAIHFLQRFRTLADRHGYQEARVLMFEEPARAIYRNAVVIALGFTPLFAAPLVPYVTVGAFMMSIMIASAGVTLVLLPAVIQPFCRLLFREPGNPLVAASANDTTGVP